MMNPRPRDFLRKSRDGNQREIGQVPGLISLPARDGDLRAIAREHSAMHEWPRGKNRDIDFKMSVPPVDDRAVHRIEIHRGRVEIRRPRVREFVERAPVCKRADPLAHIVASVAQTVRNGERANLLFLARATPPRECERAAEADDDGNEERDRAEEAGDRGRSARTRCPLHCARCHHDRRPASAGPLTAATRASGTPNFPSACSALPVFLRQSSRRCTRYRSITQM